jgi:hypothetical protein
VYGDIAFSLTEYNQKRYKRPERRFTQDSFRDKKQKSGSSKRNQGSHLRK